MMTSIFLAKLFGIAILVKVLVILLKRKEIQQVITECFNSRGTVYTVAAIEFFVGLSIILNHNVWVGWPVIITILAWLMIIEGLLALILPFNKIKSVIYVINSPRFYALGVVVGIILGVLLVFKGFVY